VNGGTVALVAAIALLALVAVLIVRHRRKTRNTTYASASRQASHSGGPVDRPTATPPTLGTHRPFAAPINDRDREMGFKPPAPASPAPRPDPVARKVVAKVEVEVRFRRFAKLPKAPTSDEPVGWTDEVPKGDLPLFSINRTLVDGKPRGGWEVKRLTPAKKGGRVPTKATATATAPAKGGRTASAPRPRRTATTAKTGRKARK
jgi:hypothetical protein